MGSAVKLPEGFVYEDELLPEGFVYEDTLSTERADLPSDPDEQEKTLNGILDTAQKTGLSLQTTEQNHQLLGQELKHIDQTWKQAQQDTLSVWKPSILERIRNYFYTPRPPGGFDRTDQPLRTVGKLGALALTEAVAGVSGRTLDIAAAKLTDETTAAGALAEVLDIERTPREESQGSLVRTLGLLKTLGLGTGPLIASLTKSQSLRIIAGSGILLGSAETVDQITEKITEGKPFDIEGIHFSAGLGVLFGAGAVGIQRFARFIKGLRKTTALATQGKAGADVTRESIRAEVRAAMKVRDTNPAEWERVMNKYVHAGMTPAERQAAMAARGAGRPVTEPAVTPVPPQPTAVPAETTAIIRRYPGAIQRAAANVDPGAVNSLMTMAQTEINALEKAVESDISAAVSELKAKAPETPVEPPQAPEAEITAPVAEEAPKKGQIDVEEKAITEPAPSPEVQQRIADEVPTGTLDPTKEKDAREIVEQHRNWIQSRIGIKGKDQAIAFGDIIDRIKDERTGKTIRKELRYSAAQVDQAYRTVQVPIDSPLADTGLYAMPGQEAKMQALGKKMVNIAKKPRPTTKKKVPSVGKPHVLPKVKIKPEDHVKAVAMAKAKESIRYAINGLLVDGDKLVAIDGQRMFIAKGKWGKDGLYLDVTNKGILGKADKSGAKFPKYEDIIPDYPSSDAIVINDLEAVNRRLQQAAVLTSEESKGVTVILNTDGSLGFAAQSPEIGHAEINVNPGGKILGGINPSFVLDALSLHAQRGDKSIKLFFPDPTRPLLTTSIDGKTQTVTMPINIGVVPKLVAEAIETPTQKTARLAREEAAAKKPVKRPPAGALNVEVVQKVHDTFVDIVEPARTAERAVGKEAVATVMRGIHNPDVAEIEFTEAELTGHDKTIGQMRKWFSQFKDKDLRNLMLSRGNPVTPEAEAIQRQAIRDLPEEFQGMKAANAIQQIADFNYAKLQEVVGEDINKVKEYSYGIYENSPYAVDSFIDTWQTTERFTKEKKWPSLADAVANGMIPRYDNPVDNLKAEYMGIARLEGMQWMLNEHLRTGKGLFVEELEKAPIEMTGVVNDPVFREYRYHPDLAKLINNLIRKNWVTTAPGRFPWVLNTLRQVNNFARTVKFAGSGFHLSLIAQQALADAGWLGFLYKKTALRGLTLGFKESDPIFKTEAYKDYIANGGGHRFSIESESERAVNQAIEEFNATASKFVKVGMLPLKIPTGFVKWMFQSYIPKVKYGKYLDRVNERTQKLGRNLKRSEKQEIIKENQNFYGMMNERLFGRSGTVTTMMRFPFMSPGFAEGNYRTMLKAIFQWGQSQEAEVLKGLPGAREKGFDASRSRSNIFNSFLLGGIAATVGTIIMTGKPPKKPETLDDMRDLMKIDTGQVDEKGRKIMIDTLTYGRDYWDIMFNLFMLRPGEATEKAFKRVGGMTAPTAKMILDMGMMASGRAIYDYKGDRVVEITDPVLQKVMKLVAHEVEELSPIAVSVFQQSRKRDLDTVTSAVGTLMGLRPTKTEEEKRNQEIINNIFSLRGQQEKLHLHLGRISNPRKAIKKYNKTVNDVLSYKFVTDEQREEWSDKLLIDEDRLLQNKAFQLASASSDDQQISRARQFLKNFGITSKQIPRLLRARRARLRAQPKKRQHPLESQPIIGDKLKERRAQERFGD
jgi:hypothetical protein